MGLSEPLRVFIGFDPKEVDAFDVCRRSLEARSSIPLRIKPLILSELQMLGVYGRPVERGNGVLFDTISGAPMSTEFALSRFLVPLLCGWKGKALFCDCDFLWRADVAELVGLWNPAYAVQVVKHRHAPSERQKMDGQTQSRYARKNWSSLMLWNCGHPAHRQLRDWGIFDRWPGLWLHQFNWLMDAQIGALPEAWNWLEGFSPESIEPKAVHFTRGIPSMPGYENALYSDEWRDVRDVMREAA